MYCYLWKTLISKKIIIPWTYLKIDKLNLLIYLFDFYILNKNMLVSIPKIAKTDSKEFIRRFTILTLIN